MSIKNELQELKESVKHLYNKINCTKTIFSDSFENFPEEGRSNTLYIDSNTGDIYIWNETTEEYQLASEADYDNMSKEMSNVEANIFKVVEWIDSSNTVRKRSTLSGGTAPKFTTRTVQIYNNSGTLLKTLVFTLSYDGNDKLISETLV